MTYVIIYRLYFILSLTKYCMAIRKNLSTFVHSISKMLEWTKKVDKSGRWVRP